MSGNRFVPAEELEQLHGHFEKLMDAIGDRPDAASDWRGTWIITSGTGDLEGLRGHGTFWGPGWLPPDGGSDECPEGMGVVYYSVEDIDGMDFDNDDDDG